MICNCKDCSYQSHKILTKEDILRHLQGRASDLVMDNSYCCYFYSPECFEIISDEYGILSRRSVYYSFHGGGDEIKKY